MALPNGDSSEPSSRAPVAFPDFRLFDSAQDILDHNKRIIKEIKGNHDAQTPEALARNCLLIRELNTNIAAVMRAYSSIGDSFQAYMDTQQQLEAQQAAAQAAPGDGGAPEGPAAMQVEGAAAVPDLQQQREEDQGLPSSRAGMEERGGDGEEGGVEQGGEAAVPDMPPA